MFTVLQVVGIDDSCMVLKTGNIDAFVSLPDIGKFPDGVFRRQSQQVSLGRQRPLSGYGQQHLKHYRRIAKRHKFGTWGRSRLTCRQPYGVQSMPISARRRSNLQL
jgi:hypothetical protein